MVSVSPMCLPQRHRYMPQGSHARKNSPKTRTDAQDTMQDSKHLAGVALERRDEHRYIRDAKKRPRRYVCDLCYR